MRLLRLGFVLMAIVLATALVGLSARLMNEKPATPRLECVEFVDLGSCPQGGIAVGRFHVKNAGGGELSLEAFRTSCSCAGVEREVNGKYLRVQSLRLSAGEEVELVIRVSVTESAGQRQGIGIVFETNDPERPRGLVDVFVSRVLGGVVTLPSAVSCGELTAGTSATYTLDVYDNGQTGRRVRSVRSTRPQRFSASLVTLTGADESREHERMGNLIAQIKIVPDTTGEGVLDGEVEIVLADEDRRPDMISVSGRVRGDIEVAPQSVILPRGVDGVAAYHAAVRVWSRDGKSVSVRILSADASLVAEALPIKEGNEGASVRIEWKPGEGRTANAQVRKVRLRIVSGGKEHDRDIQVLLRGKGE